MAQGYKYDFPVQNIVLLATGTGIAPIRAAIESGALEVETTGPFGRR
jgi:sulfite reductase alpha subunit-like flavoprotein